MNDYCRSIEELWVALNPHAQIHGCEVDPAGTVHIYVLYSRNKKQHPLELTLGNPPRTVIRGLRQALNAETRSKRLSAVSGAKIVEEAKQPKKQRSEGI
jgi:hypothetical protein